MPREHGGLATLGSSALLAGLVAPAPAVAVVAMVVYTLAYLSRGPLERRGRGVALRPWDGPALGLYGAAAAAALAYVAAAGVTAAVATGVTAAAIPAVGVLVRRRKLHRHVLVETLGLAACAGAAGVAVWAGAGSLAIAAAVGLAAAVQGAASVPLVRAELRKRAARRRGAAGALALAGAGAAAAALWSLLLAAAFAPRVVHAAWRFARPERSRRRWVVITRESVSALIFVLLVALALR